MIKKDLRKKYLKLREALSVDEVLLLSEMIFKNFINEFDPQKGQKVHIFLSISKFKEIETSFFIDFFMEKQIRVFVPKMVGDNIISIELFPNTVFEHNLWGIKEPKECIDAEITDYDFVLTPLLYSDAFGNRVGYGKGFYDRFFSTINKNSLKIGLNYFPPSEIINDVFENDIPLDYLVTPSEVLSFKGLL